NPLGRGAFDYYHDRRGGHYSRRRSLGQKRTWRLVSYHFLDSVFYRTWQVLGRWNYGERIRLFCVEKNFDLADKTSEFSIHIATATAKNFLPHLFCLKRDAVGIYTGYIGLIFSLRHESIG